MIQYRKMRRIILSRRFLLERRAAGNLFFLFFEGEVESLTWIDRATLTIIVLYRRDRFRGLLIMQFNTSYVSHVSGDSAERYGRNLRGRKPVTATNSNEL